MAIKLLTKALIFWALILTSAIGLGQCPTSVSISSSAGNTICEGTDVTFTANSNGGTAPFTYQWKINGAPVGSANTSNTFSTNSLTNGQKVSVTVTDGNGTSCSISSSDYTMTVNATKTPTASISANKTSICPGDTVTFTATNTNGGTSPQYDFFLNNNTAPLQSGSSNTYSTAELNNGDKIHVVLTSSLECTTSDTAEAFSNSIEVRAGTPVAPGTITTSVGSTICPGTSQTYSIAAVAGATSYQWTLPSGWTGSSSSTSITATAGTAGGTVSVKAVNDCGTGEAQTLDITVKAGTPAVPGNITGETAVCPGVSQTYSIGAVPDATEYIWTLPNGWTGTSTTNSITVTTGASGSGNISVQAKNDCGTSTAKTLAVSVKAGTPAQPGTITGTAAVCPGTQQTYSITGVTGATSYIWTLPNGWTGTSTTNSITATSGTTGGNITVKAINDCGTSTERVLALTVKPGTPAQPAAFTAGPAEVCPGTTATYTVPAVTGATEYIWTIPSGFSASPLTTSTPSLTVSAGSSGSGSITVTAKNDCGVSTARSMAISISKPIPVMTGSITGPAKVCSTATGLVYSIPAITNATEYVWTVPSGWTITSGGTTRSITVSAGSTASNGSPISVVAKNSCGSSSSASILVKAFNSVPAKPGDITTTLTTSVICPPINGVKFSVPIDNTGTVNSYNWKLPAGFQVVSGAGTNEITVNITTTAAYGNNIKVEVEAINNCGPSTPSTYSNINLDKFVIANLGDDITVCSSNTTLNLSGNIAFGTGNTKLRIASLTTTGTNSISGLPNPNTTVNDFTYQYTPSSQDLTAGKVTFTLTTEKPAGACAAGTDQMTVFFKPLPTATISSTGPICNGNTSTLTFTGTPNSRVTYRLPTNTTSTVDIGASGTATVTTAALTANSTYTLVSSVNLDNPVCSNTLTGSTTITVTPKPTATLTYSGTPFCTSLTTGQTPTLTGTNAYTGGSYSSTSGLSLNTSTGAITPSTSTPGTYNVTYSTPAGGGCASVTATTQVTITKQPTAAISYAGIPFCTSDSSAKAVTLTGTDGFSGGTYSASPAGLTIDSSTGAITASSSTAGTYTVTYETPNAGGCSPITTSTEVIITEAPTATISYADAPFCVSDGSAKAVTLTGTNNYTGGSYSAPAGLLIDQTSGAITPSESTVGTYTVTYTVPATSGCGEVTATTEVAITQTPSVEISYAGPFCTSDAAVQPVVFSNGIGAYEGGTFSSNPGGLNIDPDTGGITAEKTSPGTYTVSYTIPASLGCDVVVVDTEVIITKLPQVVISYDTPFCNSDPTLQPVTYSGTFGDYSGGVFTATDGLSIDTQGNINAQASTPGIHTVTYTKDTADDGCAVVEATTQIEIFEKVLITTQPVNFGTCSSNPASFEVVATGDNLTYQWFKKDAGGTFVQLNGETNPVLSFSNATSANEGEYRVVVSSSNAVCSSETSDPVTLNIDEDIIITKPVEDITICENDYKTLSFEYEAHANGAELFFQWVKDGENINPTEGKYVMEATGPEGADGVYSGVLTIQNIDVSDDGVYAVKITGPDSFTCSEATSKSFTFRVNKRPDAPVTTAVEYCLGSTPTALTATKASEENELLWYSYNSATDEYTYLGTSVTPTTDAPGQTSYWVSQKQPNSCESDKAELVVTVNDKPQPIATETIQFSYCFNETVSDPISITPTEGSTINWYDAVDASTALSSAPTPNTSVAKLTSYWVSQTLTSTGCESDRTKVDIIINELPNVTINVVEGYNAEICKGSETKIVASGATNYIWYYGENVIGETSEVTILGENAGTFEYRVVGTDDNGCVNENVISIEVEEPSEGGTVSGPSSVCITDNQGTITVADFNGEIQRWESSTDGTNWTSIAVTTETLDFQNLSGTTTFRAIVKNGVCAEVPSTEITVSVDPAPVGGELAFDGFGRTIETCSNPGPDYNIPLSLTGQEGDIVRWRYKEGSATQWSTVMENGEIFTGTVLSPALIRSLGINQSTIFEVEMGSGACSPNVFSQNATLGIVSSDIAPNPVTVTPGVVCFGEEVTLSGSTGYGTGPGMEAGAFDYSSITNKGWRIKDKNGVESNFDSSADNGVAAIWLRTNPLPLTTANLTSPYTTYTYRNWDSSAGDEGNKGFAVVSGPNPSTLETSVFNLFAVDNPVLTFDQAYNLTPGSAIYVDISTDGGANYNPVPLYELIATNATDGTSGNYDSFGDDDANPENKITLDLTEYANLPNLRIRFRYVGTRPGDVWAVDAISLPVEPTNVDLTWTDYTDPENPIVIGTDNSEQWAPKLIGWNDFEIRTRLTFDSTGQQCPVVENWKTVSVFVFDQYTSTATAIAGTCGTETVVIKATVLNSSEVDVAGTKTRDGYEGQWEVVSGPADYTFSSAHFTNDDTTIAAVKDPNATFTPGVYGDYTLRWVLSTSAVGADGKSLANENCPPVYNTVTFSVKDCTALDFDGVDDYVDLGNNYQGSLSFEAWIRPFNRPLPDNTGETNASNGTIISGPGFEIGMNDLPTSSITPGTRWYHIAVSKTGELWIDGISAGSITLNGNGGNKTIIGAKWDPSNKETENHFSGWIEEVRIWNGDISQDQIRFLMNQRLQNSANIGVEIPMPAPGLSYSALAGYYQLLTTSILNGGYTPDLATAATNGKLRNMETLQENTAPLPYTSKADGQWINRETWTQPVVWDFPNSTGYGGAAIEWNIVKTNHNIFSGEKDIKVLGLKVESNELEIADPANVNPDWQNSGQKLEVTHYLRLDGSIDLIGESQLLQPLGSVLEEASAGFLERDQQGTQSSFNYNYWSSPVSAQGAANNADYSIGSVLTNPAGTIDYVNNAFAADATAKNASNVIISSYWLWAFKPGVAGEYAEWDYLGSTGTLRAVEGFTMKGTSGAAAIADRQNYTFKGKPHNGKITGQLIGTEQNYLVGNPYPSAIDSWEFMLDNLTGVKSPDNISSRGTTNVFNGSLYFWDHFAGATHYLEQYIGGYATLNFSGSVEAVSTDWRINANNARSTKKPGRFIPVSQGFFLNTAAFSDATSPVSGGVAVFDNNQRIYERETSTGGSLFLSQEKKGTKTLSTNKQQEDTRSKIWIKYKSPKGYHRQLLVTADASATDGFDLGYDAPLIEDNIEDMYWYFNKYEFVIQAVKDFNLERELDLGFKVEQAGSLTISIDELMNIPADMNIYVKDSLKQITHNLRESDYTTESEAGTFTDRFKIVFQDATPPDVVVDPVEDVDNGNFEVMYVNGTREILVKNPDLLSIDRIYLNNLLGQQVHVFYNIPTQDELYLPVQKFSSGVYVVKVHSEKGISTKKVILE